MEMNWYLNLSGEQGPGKRIKQMEYQRKEIDSPNLDRTKIC